MKKKIIVAPLNWGLGHATRCVPIIRSLIKNNFTPIIASDGKALAFLQKEFPNLETLKLPSYNLFYRKNLKMSLFLQVPKIWKAVKKEQKKIGAFITENKDVIGIISDNRFGVQSSKIPSVYLTHQINVLSGFTTFFTSKIHQHIIKNFNECWIPDNLNSEFSGKLSSSKEKLNQKFIGVLSRFQKVELPKNIDILVIVSGVEPNRTSFEKRIKNELKNYNGNVVLVQGKIETSQKTFEEKNITVYNFMLSEELQNAINSAKIVVSRSGYSSIMDLSILNKKAFFIPTKSQTEQEYLANYLSENKVIPFCSEENFTVKKLSEVKNYSGLSTEKTKISANLFSLFKRK